jgi:hypothetical protein
MAGQRTGGCDVPLTVAGLAGPIALKALTAWVDELSGKANKIFAIPVERRFTANS